MLPQKSMLSLWDSFSAILASNGISTTWLFVGITVFFIVALLAFREFMCWYLKIYQTQALIKKLESEILDLKKNLNSKPDLTPQIKTEPTQERSADRFVHFN